MNTDLGFIDRLPPHKAGLALYHNEHRNYYQTVAEWIALDAGDYTWKDESSKQKAIETNELWLLHWYPDTPVACYSLAAPSLEELLEMAAEAAGVDHRRGRSETLN